MKIIAILVFLSFIACSENKKNKQTADPIVEVDLVSLLDTVWSMEQTPIRMRDSLMKIYGTESELVQIQQDLYKKNHAVNEKKIIEMLDKQGWPNNEIIGERGNLTICNVIQHSEIEVRQKYLPMMKVAVREKKLEPRFLARAEDRLATDKGELQIYGGQVKFYPETKTFDVWPIFDPEHVDERRAEIGLGPIAEFLGSDRFQLEWNIEDQIKRTKEFERKRQLEMKTEN